MDLPAHSLFGPGSRVPFTDAARVHFAAVDARRVRAQWEDWKLQSNSLGYCKVANNYPDGEGRGAANYLVHLGETVKEARRGRGNRKQLRAPSRPTRAGHTSLFARMNWHLRRVARRALDQWFIHGHDAIDVEQLGAALAEYVREEHGRLVYYREPGEGPLGRTAPRWLDGDGAVERVAMSAASYALRRWSPTNVMKQQLRSAAGGRKSRRGATKTTPQNAQRLATLLAAEPHLTVKQLALRLDMKERSVYTLKRKHPRRHDAGPEATAAPRS